MFKTRSVIIAMTCLVLVSSWAVHPLIVAAEDNSQSDRPQMSPEGGFRPQARPDGTRTGPMDSQEVQMRMLERIKIDLAATEQEWKAIEPSLKKVITLSNELNPRVMGAAIMDGRQERSVGRAERRDERSGQIADQAERREGQRGWRADAADESKCQKAFIELRDLTQLSGSSASDINDKLVAFRAAKADAQKELAAEQVKLQKTLTPRQEAKLVLMGTLN